MSGSWTVTVAYNPYGPAWGEVVLARSSLTLHPPSPPTVLWLSCLKVSQCINYCDYPFTSQQQADRQSKMAAKTVAIIFIITNMKAGVWQSWCIYRCFRERYSGVPSDQACSDRPSTYRHPCCSWTVWDQKSYLYTEGDAGIQQVNSSSLDVQAYTLCRAYWPGKMAQIQCWKPICLPIYDTTQVSLHCCHPWCWLTVKTDDIEASKPAQVQRGHRCTMYDVLFLAVILISVKTCVLFTGGQYRWCAVRF